MEAILLAVPFELLRDQILPFLSLNELVKLDTATCHKKFRISFHEHIQGVTYVKCEKLNRTIVSTSHILKWLSDRKIFLEKICLNLNLDMTDQVFAACGTAFAKTKNCSICYSNITQKGLTSFADNCPNLEYLKLYWCGFLISGESVAYLSSQCLKLCTLTGFVGLRMGKRLRR